MSEHTANREEELFQEKVITQTTAQSCARVVPFQEGCVVWSEQNEGVWGVRAGGDDGGKVRPGRKGPCVPSSEAWKSVDSGEREPVKFSKQRDDGLIITMIATAG